MNKLSKIIYGLLIAVLVIWLVPWTFDFFTYKPETTPFTIYSSVIDDFAMTEMEEGRGLVRKDLSGREYEEKEFDAILPLFFVRQLVADERFPDSVNGVAITPKEARMGNFVFRSAPHNVNKPSSGLNFLLESFSGRVDLVMPSDVFRFTNQGIEFVEMNTNTLNLPKSKLFTEVMLRKGFEFPAQLIDGIATTRKAYDEGYLLTDKVGKLFHFKMVAGRPYVRHIELPTGVNLQNVFITEFNSKCSLGFLIDTAHQFYVLTPNYEVHKVDIPGIDTRTEAFTVFGNLFDWTFKISSTDRERYYAVDSENYQLIKEHEFLAKNNSFGDRYRSLLMPLRLNFTSGYDKFVYPRINQ